MTLAEAPFWVWIPLVLNSGLFLLLCLAPLLWEWHEEDQIKAKLQPVPLMVETRQINTVAGIVLNK